MQSNNKAFSKPIEKSMHYKLNYKYLFFILIFFLILVIYNLKDNLNEISSIDSNLNKCSVINKNFKQYYAYFDGIRYPRSMFLFKNYSFDFNFINKSSPMKKILYWNTFFGDMSYGFGLGKVQPFNKMNCPGTNCEAISDKNRLNESDVVLVHMRDTFEMPQYRKKNQKWIFVIQESQIHSNNFTYLNSFFNETSTFQQNSDYYNPYEIESNFYWGKNENFNEDRDYLADKKEFAAAVISNCNDNSRRLDLIKVLQKYIPVKIFGSCGIPCPGKTNCKQNISSTFKFYFAFENSVCKDYITEKFFEILKYDIIPVVYGGGNYDNYVMKFLRLSIVLRLIFSFFKDSSVGFYKCAKISNVKAIIRLPDIFKQKQYCI